jgi:hypothetical protein
LSEWELHDISGVNEGSSGGVDADVLRMRVVEAAFEALGGLKVLTTKMRACVSGDMCRIGGLGCMNKIVQS